MTDNMKKFLEEASQDKEFIGELGKAVTPEALIALAKEKGFTLTEEDLKTETREGIVSDDELNAVSGGKACACVIYGLGEDGGNDETCSCGVAGSGYGYNEQTKGTEGRCYCVGAGGGTSEN